MVCKCGKPFAGYDHEISTLVGYLSPNGHDHDDNCRSRTYYCDDDHTTVIRKRNRCPSCDWVGRDECSVCNTTALDEWPEVR